MNKIYIVYSCDRDWPFTKGIFCNRERAINYAKTLGDAHYESHEVFEYDFPYISKRDIYDWDNSKRIYYRKVKIEKRTAEETGESIKKFLEVCEK